MRSLPLVRRLENAPGDDRSPVLEDGLDEVVPLLFDDVVTPDPLLHCALGPNLIEERWARAAWGVYRALHTGCNGVVALKVLQGIHAQGDAGRARLKREAEILARCKHPGIVQIYFGDVLPCGDTYFTMEFVDGRSITQHCQAEALSLEARLGLFVDVCGALQSAHTVGIIHRDLKSAPRLQRANQRLDTAQ